MNLTQQVPPLVSGGASLLGYSPTSSVNPLPAQSPTSFLVTWSGQADAGSSGISFYDVYVSDNGGAFIPLLTHTTQTSATFAGSFGHSYGFYSVATDGDGGAQPTPVAAQATTTVQAVPALSNLSAPTIPDGTASTTISGHLDANAGGQLIPAGETVHVTLNGLTQNATLDSNDNFSITFDTSALSLAGSPYTIAFSYSGDGNFASASGTSTLTVLNAPPLAQDDTASTMAGTPVVINVLANDTEPDEGINPTTVAITSNPVNGMVSVAPSTGQVTYTPNAGFTGTDTFKYTVNDYGGLTSNQATVTIVVKPVLGKVLILGPTVTGGAASREAQEATAQGFAVDVVSPATWSSMTAAQFASYRAIVLGDPTCGGPGTAGYLDAPLADESVWGPVVNGPGGGNAIIIGTDPVFHATYGNNQAGASHLIKSGMDFVLNTPAGKTGIYVDLSCYYAGSAPGTPVPLLDVFSPGGFSVRGPDCTDSGHIVATTSDASLGSLTDADLSNWECSVHEAFDKFDPSFDVVAIDENAGSSFTASDGTQGDPYILARGTNLRVISDVQLSPPTDSLSTGTNETLTATVTSSVGGGAGTPIAGTLVSFSVISGPNAGTTGTGVTNAAGQATFTYTSSVTGTDFVHARFVDSGGHTETSANSEITWLNTPPSFGNLSSPTIAYGTVSTTISGHLNPNAGGQPVPGGEAVQVSLNGVTQAATLDSEDNFSTTFATGTLGVAGSPFSIAFSYGGDANFKPASGSSTLMITPAATGTILGASLLTPLAGVDRVALTASVTVMPPGGGGPTGSVDFFDTTTGIDLGTAPLSGGTATLNLQPLGIGAHVLQATYSGDGNLLSSSGTASLTALAPSSLSGSVFADFNDDGQIDFGENGISGVSVHLTGTDDLGHAVDRIVLTDGDGAYVFLNLRAGSYYLTRTTQPAGYTPGIDSVGTAGGSLSTTVADQFFIQLAQAVNGLNYNYGERPAAGGPVQKGQTAGIGFWNNKNGQALILALNGGGSSHELGDWLAATFVNLYGANSGNDLAGQSNAYVAALFQQDFLEKGPKLDAQVLATALSVYATNATLDGTRAAAKYGFTVSGYGLGTATFNVGGNGDAFGVADDTTMTVMDLLLATDAQAVNGVLYGGNQHRRDLANAAFSALNQAGGI
jgi:hypothetical protein